ncbi:H-NS family nucleoid-associated regulatory protein [Cupriavidus sp. YAF13]|uniref:H-NS family nucleoid-associated regulatory protein n=1 Tax=Cupriavidus sp. YAF13 TaxID=3233075 RepID=UPI003F8F6116
MTSPQAGELLHVRVADLTISPRNVRKTPSSTINELAASIWSHGLMQNLTVTTSTSRKKNAAAYEVIAGGRRLLALQQLISQRILPKDHEVLCILRDVSGAEEASIAENMHEAMHPADEFEAFKGLIDAGSSVDDVAARFGVTPLVVRRRLKLANISPRLIDEYRAGNVKLDQLTALAISDNHADQERVWDSAKGWNRNPQALREALVDKAIDASRDRLARFVGLDAYEAAGGPVTRDLFSDGGGYIGDGQLLKRLAMEKLEAIADQVRAENWSWVEARDKLDYSEEHSFGRSQPKKRQATTEEAAQLEQLEARARQLDDLLQDDDSTEEQQAEFDRVEAEIANLKAGLEDYTERQKSRAGAIVTIDHSGVVEIHRGMIKPAKDGKKPRDLPADDGNSETPTQAPQAPTLSATLVQKLTAHRTAALQALVAGAPAVALTALLYALVPDVFQSSLGHRFRYDAVAKVSITDQRGSVSSASADMEASPAWQSMEASVARWEDRMPGEDEDLFTWLQDLSQADQLDLLAVCVAHSINTFAQREDSAGHARANQLAEAVDLDMADWWQPTADSYLASVPASRRIEAVREAAGEETAAGLEGMKKADMIAAAEGHLDGRRWLPEVLRRPVTKPASNAPASKKTNQAPIRYRDEAGNTWTGRGKRPTWLTKSLESGKTLEDFLVMPEAA